MRNTRQNKSSQPGWVWRLLLLELIQQPHRSTVRQHVLPILQALHRTHCCQRDCVAVESCMCPACKLMTVMVMWKYSFAASSRRPSFGAGSLVSTFAFSGVVALACAHSIN